MVRQYAPAHCVNLNCVIWLQIEKINNQEKAYVATYCVNNCITLKVYLLTI